jgi:hypothetical protein
MVMIIDLTAAAAQRRQLIILRSAAFPAIGPPEYPAGASVDGSALVSLVTSECTQSIGG